MKVSKTPTVPRQIDSQVYKSGVQRSGVGQRQKRESDEHSLGTVSVPVTVPGADRGDRCRRCSARRAGQ